MAALRDQLNITFPETPTERKYSMAYVFIAIGYFQLPRAIHPIAGEYGSHTDSAFPKRALLRENPCEPSVWTRRVQMTEAESREHRPRVVIIGAGFAGLSAAKALRNAPFDVIVIDQHNYHLFQPL